MQNLSHGDWIQFENPGIVNMSFSLSSLDFCVAKPVLAAKSQLTDEKIISLYIFHLKYCHKRVSLQSDTHSTSCFKPFRLFKGAGLLQRACVHYFESGKFKDCIKTGKMWLFPSLPCATVNQPYPEGGCTLLLMGVRGRRNVIIPHQPDPQSLHLKQLGVRNLIFIWKF